MRKSQLAVWLSAATLALAACGDGAVRSPDLPPVQLTGIGQVTCSPHGVSSSDNTFAVGQTGQCVVTGACVYQSVDKNGNAQQTAGACPDNLTFTSRNPDTATITPEGELTGVKPGATEIIASGDGLSSDPVDVTVSTACASVSATGASPLTLNPQTLTLRSSSNSGSTERIRAELLLSDGSTVQVGALPGMEWTLSDTTVVSAGTTQLTQNQFTAAAGVTEPVLVQVTGTYSGALLCAGTPPQTQTADITVRPAQLEDGASSICIETIPPAQAFEGCRPITIGRRVCLTPNLPIQLTVGEERQVQVRGIFDDDQECNITDTSTLELVPDNGVATIDQDGTLTGVRPNDEGENTVLRATFDGINKERPVAVKVNQVLGKNSLVVFAKAMFNEGDAMSLIDAQDNKFACVGANNLVVDGLGNKTPRAALKAFAYVATCDNNMLDESGNCIAPIPDDENADPTAAAFLATAPTKDVSNQQSPRPVLDPYNDGIEWRTVAGYWGEIKDPDTGETSLGCVTKSADPSAHVGDLYKEERKLLLGVNGKPIEPGEDSELPPGAFQPNGLVYSDAAVRIGFNCVIATYTNPENPNEKQSDGMTVLVLPVTNDILLGGSNDGAALCEALAPLFGNGALLGILPITDILAAVTNGLTPLLEALDVLPIDGLVTQLQNILGPITGPLINGLDNFVVDPLLEPLVCQLTNGVGGLLGLLTGNKKPPANCPSFGFGG